MTKIKICGIIYTRIKNAEYFHTEGFVMKAELIISEDGEYALVLRANSNILYDACQWCVYDRSEDKLYKLKRKTSPTLTLSQNQVENGLKGKDVVCMYYIPQQEKMDNGSKKYRYVQERYVLCKSLPELISHKSLDSIFLMDMNGVISQIYNRYDS